MTPAGKEGFKHDVPFPAGSHLRSAGVVTCKIRGHRYKLSFSSYADTAPHVQSQSIILTAHKVLTYGADETKWEALKIKGHICELFEILTTHVVR